MQWRQKVQKKVHYDVRHGVKKHQQVTSGSTPWSQKVPKKVRYDVKTYVMTSKSTTQYQIYILA